jgi:hypothetical protein
MPRSLAIASIVAAAVLAALQLPGYAILPLGLTIMVNGQKWTKPKKED